MNVIDVKIKKLHKDAVIPKYAYENDAGADIIAIDFKETDKYIEYFTGISMEFDPSFVCCLFPRSSITKKDLMLKNSVGVGDPDFRNGYTFRFWKTKENGDYYKKFEKIGQIVFLPKYSANFIECEELNTTDRNMGGYGSSDEKI